LSEPGNAVDFTSNVETIFTCQLPVMSAFTPEGTGTANNSAKESSNFDMASPLT